MLPKSLRPLFPYLKKYRGSYFGGDVCVFLNNGIWILFPLVIRRAIDDLIWESPAKSCSPIPCCCWRWRRPKAFSSF